MMLSWMRLGKAEANGALMFDVEIFVSKVSIEVSTVLIPA